MMYYHMHKPSVALPQKLYNNELRQVIRNRVPPHRYNYNLLKHLDLVTSLLLAFHLNKFA